MANEWLLKHGHRPKSGGSKTYTSWISMKERCSDKNNKHYGGRNISVCERWLNFSNFLEDMGERPEKTTLDRIDFNGNYEPLNCRWVDAKAQARNKSGNVFAEINGMVNCLKDWADMYSIPTTTIYRRFHNGIRGEGLIKKPRFKTPSKKPVY